MANTNAKQRAAEARAAAEAADKRRKRMINLAIFGVLAVVVLGLVGGAYLASKNNRDQLQPSADAALPTGVLPSGDPYRYGFVASETDNGPTLQLWEDFQCPGCGSFEAQFGATLDEIVADESARVIYRSTSFLDARIPGDNSKRAAAAFGCAIDAGQGLEYHNVVFQNQPEEGVGYTDAQLLAFGEQAGITGDAKSTFDRCVTDRTYIQWAVNGTATMGEDGVGSTPTIILNGVKMTDAQMASPEAFKQAIESAGAQ